MAKSKIFQAFTGKKWVELKQSKPGDNTGFKAAEAAGLPIRILWASGSFKVLRNAHALPETKPYAKKKGRAAEKPVKPKASVPSVAKAGKGVVKAVLAHKANKPVFEDYSIIGAGPEVLRLAPIFEDYSIIGA